MRGEQLEASNSRSIIFQIFSSLQILSFNTQAAKIMLRNPPGFAFPTCCIRFVQTSNKNFLCKNSQVAGFKKQADFPVAWKGRVTAPCHPSSLLSAIVQEYPVNREV